MRGRIFIDFWNFQLNWNGRMDVRRCDWRALPGAIIGEAQRLIAETGASEPISLEETLLYASVDPTGPEANLRKWLTTVVERMPSYRVKIRERRPQKRSIHCGSCGTDTANCPNCQEPFTHRPEKGVDTAIVTDLLSLAHQQSYDVAAPRIKRCGLHPCRRVPPEQWPQGDQRLLVGVRLRPEGQVLGLLRSRQHCPQHLPP